MHGAADRARTRGRDVLGQVGNLLPHVVVPAIMAQHLMPLWGLTAAQAGLMASGYTFGYMLAVPLLATLTDRIDARHILAAGSILSGLATVMFGLLADDLWSATLIWAIAGIGFAGAYMPGLKALADRLSAGDVSRSVTLYTGSFSIGVGLSFLVAQLVADNSGWRAAFYVTGAGPLMMLPVCLGLAPHKPPAAPGHLLDLRPVLRNRPALGYILGYGAHSFELYGMRTWLVAFWAFVVAQSEGAAPIGPITVSVIVTLLSLPASVLGNEAALRYGRHRAITAVMIASAFLDRERSPFGFTVSIEPHWNRIDDIAGERVQNYGGTVTVALDKEVVARRLYAAINVLYQPEVTHFLDANTWVRQSTVGISGALAVQVRSRVFVGGEVVYRHLYDGLGFDSFAGRALFLGPTFYARLSEHWWASLAWNIQVAGHAADQPGALDLVNFERHRALLRLGYHF